MRGRRFVSISLLASLCALAAGLGSAHAQSGVWTEGSRLRDACRKDARYHCSTSHSHFQIIACLQKRKTQLSPACRSRLNGYIAFNQNWYGVCAKERETVCSVRQHYLLNCLEWRWNELSEGCRAALTGRTP